MSGYEKPSIADLSDYDGRRQSQSLSSLTVYDASRAPQEPMYMFALPGQADSHLQPTSPAYDRHGDQITPYTPGAQLQARVAYSATEPLYNDYETRKVPEVFTSFQPQTGTDASQVFVYLNANTNLLDPSPMSASLMFGERRVPASLTPLKTQTYDDCFRYVVSGNAPPFSELDSSSSTVSLRLQFHESAVLGAGLVDVGLWRYADEKQSAVPSSPEITRKRKNTLDPQERSTPTKRHSTESQTTFADYLPHSYPPESISANPQALHSIDLSSVPRKLTPYGKSENRQSLQENSATMGVDEFARGFPASQSIMRPPVTQTSSYIPSYKSSYQSGRSPRANPTPSFQMSSSSSPNPANPPLVRASQLQSGSASTPSASSTDVTFNPYAMYPNKAIIRIRGGDLNSMQDNWTAEERAAKRRLVRFQGEQDGSTINTYFKAVKPEDRPSSHETRERRISCIYWEERDDYWVTSVDTIALLETLVGARFTVEEKNRIRRNLETHHPETVSKGKKDTEGFFKVIMGLPHPKPRNIEKDVKVFPWPILGQALRKVIGKYSASPASTAGPMSTSRALTYSGARSDASSDRYTHLSSRSSTGSGAYASTLSSSTLSPPTPSQSLSTQYSEASPLPLTIAALPQSYHFPTLASQNALDDGRTSLGASYAGQTPVPMPSPTYAAYTGSTQRGRVSHEMNAEALLNTDYPSRSRANTFQALYQANQDPSSDYAMSQIPNAYPASRSSYDMTSFSRSDPMSFHYHDVHGTQYRPPSRQNSNASQYPQATAEPSTSQSKIH